MIKKLTVLALLIFGANCYALINGQGHYGLRQYAVKDAADNDVRIQGKATTLSVHFDPIPFIPISAGFTYSSVMMDKDAFTGSPDTAEISELGLEVAVWIPMVPVVTPYAKVRLVLDSELKFGGGSGNSDATLTGTHINLGVTYPLLPLVSLGLELSQAFQEIDSFGGKKQSFNSQGVALGVQVGI